jgi:uncharacterized protein (TIRG00374 family)
VVLRCSHSSVLDIQSGTASFFGYIGGWGFRPSYTLFERAMIGYKYSSTGENVWSTRSHNLQTTGLLAGMLRQVSTMRVTARLELPLEQPLVGTTRWENSMGEEGTRRSWLLKIIKYSIGVAALVWIIKQVDWARTVALLADIPPEVIVALVVLSGLGRVAGFSMWYVLINRVRRVRFLVAVSAGLTVLFINHLLPSRLSGRAAAPFVIHNRTGMNYADAVAVSGVHTGLYAVLYGLVSFIGLVFGFSQLPLGLVAVLLLSTALYVVSGGLVLLAGTHLGVLNWIIDRTDAIGQHIPVVGDRFVALTEKLPSFMTSSATTFRTLVTDPVVLLSYVGGWTIAILIARGLRVWLVFTGLGVEFEPVFLLPVYLLTAYSVTLLPLTPGGIGVAEATGTAVLVAFGIPSEVAISAIIVDRFLGTYLPAVVGWYPSLQMDLSGLFSE